MPLRCELCCTAILPPPPATGLARARPAGSGRSAQGWAGAAHATLPSPRYKAACCCCCWRCSCARGGRRRSCCRRLTALEAELWLYIHGPQELGQQALVEHLLNGHLVALAPAGSWCTAGGMLRSNRVLWVRQGRGRAAARGSLGARSAGRRGSGREDPVLPWARGGAGAGQGAASGHARKTVGGVRS